MDEADPRGLEAGPGRLGRARGRPRRRGRRHPSAVGVLGAKGGEPQLAAGAAPGGPDRAGGGDAGGDQEHAVPGLRPAVQGCSPRAGGGQRQPGVPAPGREAVREAAGEGPSALSSQSGYVRSSSRQRVLILGR